MLDQNTKYNPKSMNRLIGIAIAGLAVASGLYVTSCIEQNRRFREAKEQLEVLPIEQAQLRQGQGIDSFTSETVSVSEFPRTVRREVFLKQNRLTNLNQVSATGVYKRPYELTPEIISKNREKSARFVQELKRNPDAWTNKSLYQTK